MSNCVQQRPERIESKLTIITILARHSIPLLLPFVQPLRYRFVLSRIRPGNAAEESSILLATGEPIFCMDTLRSVALLGAVPSFNPLVTTACISQHYTRLGGICV